MILTSVAPLLIIVFAAIVATRARRKAVRDAEAAARGEGPAP